MSIFEYIISALAPHLCLGCRKEGALLCNACCEILPLPVPTCVFCRRRVRGKRQPYSCLPCRAALPFNDLIIAAAYEGVAKELVHKLKFERARAAVNPIARVLAVRIESASFIRGGRIVVHVPTAAQRARQRGYDQSALIARQLAHDLNLSSSTLLRRQGNERQLGQGRRVRRQQLQEVFWTNKNLAGKHILLVDDVITTGSSVIAAASTLRDAGAASITVAAFARA